MSSVKKPTADDIHEWLTVWREKASAFRSEAQQHEQEARRCTELAEEAEREARRWEAALSIIESNGQRSRSITKIRGPRPRKRVKPGRKQGPTLEDIAMTVLRTHKAAWLNATELTRTAMKDGVWGPISKHPETSMNVRLVRLRNARVEWLRFRPRDKRYQWGGEGAVPM